MLCTETGQFGCRHKEDTSAGDRNRTAQLLVTETGQLNCRQKQDSSVAVDRNGTVQLLKML